MKPTEVTVEKTEVPELSDETPKGTTVLSTTVERFEARGNHSLPAVQTDSPNAVIMMAMQNNYTPELIEKMMDLQARHEANEARKAYYRDMAAWKAVAPEISKDKTVSFQTSKGKTEYKHATLGHVSEAISKSMSPFGLSISWPLAEPKGKIKVTCRCSHKLGHFEETTMTGPLDNTGSKNVIQQAGSTITYLQRYTLLALTGLAAHDMDNDGATPRSEPEFITEAEVKALTKRMKKIYKDGGIQFLEWLQVETVDTIPPSQYTQADEGLATAEKAKAEAAKESKREMGQDG
jgi:hypothetical protein